MQVTIKDVAKYANVSIATVSHVINKTRYVSPELVQRVMQAVERTGYDAKIGDISYKLRVGKLSEIAMILPSFRQSIYMDVVAVLSKCIEEEGFTLVVYVTGDDPYKEKCIVSGLLANKRIAGIVLVPTSGNPKKYSKLMNSTLPFVCVGRTLETENVYDVLYENDAAAYSGTSHLIKNGHKRVGLLLDKKESVVTNELIKGYQKAMDEYGIQRNEALVFRVDSKEKDCLEKLSALQKNGMPTAFVVCGDTLVHKLTGMLKKCNIDYPDDISLVGIGEDSDDGIGGYLGLTMLGMRADMMAKSAAQLLLGRINNKEAEFRHIRIRAELVVRKSIRIIERGPLGEKGYPPEELALNEDEIQKLKNANYKVGISFHYSGTEWTRLHERAIRNTLDQFGVKVVAVTEAHFDPELQIAQLEGLRMQKLDAIISMPVDEKQTAQKYKELSKETKLILISGLPYGFEREDYCSIVSVNEHENGRNAGQILGEYFKGRQHIKVGMINHGLPFFITRQRDCAAEQMLSDNYKNIDIVAQDNFLKIDNAYEVCKKMMRAHPEIEGLYVSWERPALEVIRALKEIGRTDVSIATVDLDHEIASYMARGEMVRGLSAQRPYEQGEAAALATANALLGKKQFKYVGVNPQMVLPENLREAWKEIIRTEEPSFLKELHV